MDRFEIEYKGNVIDVADSKVQALGIVSVLHSDCGYENLEIWHYDLNGTRVII